MKNPLSPLWHTMTPNQSHMPTLAEYKNWVDTKTSREALVRHAAAAQSELGITPSNMLFNTLRDRAVALLIEWHFRSDVHMSGSKVALADHLHVALEEHARKTGLDDRQVGYVIGKVSDYLALNFDPARIQGTNSRNRILHIVDGMTSVRERQRAGADYSNGVRKDRSLEKLVTAYRAMVERSEVIGLERLASKAGISRSAAYRHFRACQQICASGCIDKKVGLDPRIGNSKEACGQGVNSGNQVDQHLLQRIAREDLNTAIFTHVVSQDDDIRCLQDHEAWLAMQEGRIPARQTHESASDVSDIIFDNQPYLAVTEAVFSNALKIATRTTCTS